MPPLLSPSPLIIDHSFPRDEGELRRAAIALGQLAGLVERGEAKVLVTETLRTLVQMFDNWAPPYPSSLVRDIYQLLDQWILQPHAGVVILDVSDVQPVGAHPVPTSCEEDPLVGEWAVEMSRVLAAHDQVTDGQKYFIGIACDWAFSGGQLSRYTTAAAREFPLVGPDSFSNLLDADRWIATPASKNQSVSFAEAKRNAGAIGATRVTAPADGSHYQVHFANGHKWPLDRNTDPIPEAFLKELVPITGFPLIVLIGALKTGLKPSRVSRLVKWVI